MRGVAPHGAGEFELLATGEGLRATDLDVALSALHDFQGARMRCYWTCAECGAG